MATLPIPQPDENNPILKLLGRTPALLPAPSMPIVRPTFGSADGMVPSAPPNLPAPAAPHVLDPSSPLGRLQPANQELARLQSTGSGISQIHNPVGRGLAEAGDTILRVLAPRIEQQIPGTIGHNLQLQGRVAGQIGQNLGEAQQQAQTGLTQAQTADQLARSAREQALADKYGSQASSMRPLTVTPELAQAAGVPELAGQTLSQATYEKIFGTTANNASKQTIAQGNNETKVQTTGMNNDTSRANNTANNQAHESIATAANKTRVLVAQMHDATSRANNENTNNHKGAGGQAPGGGFKVPADVTKRAALANNVNENADAVDALLTRDPNIVGRAGGRYSTVQQMIGSDDPDIAELGVRMHNIALASNGAHGVRAQQAIQQTEDELFHHFTSGPNAIHSALNATKTSVQTFLDDEANYQQSGHRTGDNGAPPAGAKIRDYTTLGNK